MPHHDRQAAYPNRIHEWRKRRNMTLRDVATAIGVTHATVHRMETGVREVNQAWMEKLAKVFNITAADLLLLRHGGLTERERAMITTYRAIPELNRRMIDTVIDGQLPFAAPPDAAQQAG